MKFMTWNVNGIRALTQYHPYCDDLHKNYREILDYLDADVICLQETKISRSKLESDLALVPGYDSYWSFHRTKSGYSGVVIYVKDHLKLLAAEEGISGIISGNITIPSDSNPSTAFTPPPQQGSSGMTRRVGGYPQLEIPLLEQQDDVQDFDPSRTPPPSQALSSAATVARLQELDSEGRGLVLDFGFFVLFNLYCPNETDETRLPFKMDYYHLLEARVRGLIQEGREVMILGDMNVIPTELDHCDPEKWKKECGCDDFTNTQPRRWFNAFLAPGGPMTDLYRVFHEGERGAFTCWNTKINARPSNYGTRLDYILVTSGLLPWFKSCNRKPQVVGSDHCPVVAEMFTELVLEKDPVEIVKGREMTASAAAEASRDDIDASLSEVTLDANNNSKRSRQLQDILDSYGGTNDHVLAAKYYDEFSGKQQKLSMFFKKPAAAAAATATEPSPSQMTPPPLSSGKRPSSTPDVGGGSTTSSNASSVRSTVTQGKAAKKPVPGSKTVTGSQQSMLSFFTSPASKSKQVAPADTTTDIATTNGNETLALTSASTAMDTSSTQLSSQPSLSLSQPLSLPETLASSSSTASTTFCPSDFADWIPGPNDTLPFQSNAEETTSTWQNLFQPRKIPKCKFHSAPCTEYTVNKKGPNKGRRFFLCSL
ncbi:Class II abasic (AP) endonuclease [Gryganskiella cystojenkinii]|nr:Class II abasic (AP) endonuclease [Gryganskiella cystojenkinii]